MYCCSNCFKNEEIGLIIRSISSINGSCDYCCESPVQLVDVREIVEPLQPVINLYEVSTKGEYLLHEMIQNDWSIFNLTPENANRILIDIFKDERSINREKFTEKVINVTSNHSKSLSIVEQWNALKKEIVEKNRFFIENVIDLDQLKTYLKSKAKSYKSGDIFYRGRISKQYGLGIPDIGKPPAEKATAGRANPKGIPYLYLALDIETTLYETRATYLDYVTIGTFRLKEDISIVKLRAIEILSPFEENIFEKLIYLPFLKSLENDLSKPLRRYDSELDYLPTQYLCEFIKSIGFDGVEYGSSMKKSGVNIAVFDDSKFECTDIEIKEIRDITISY